MRVEGVGVSHTGLSTLNERILTMPMSHTVSFARMSSSDSTPGRPVPSAKGSMYSGSVRFGSVQLISIPMKASVAFVPLL